MGREVFFREVSEKKMIQILQSAFLCLPLQHENPQAS